MKFFSFSEISARGDCTILATDIFNTTIRNGRCAATWRGGDNPEAVSIDKERWFDHVSKQGGGILQLAAFQFGGNIQAAQEFLGDYLHLEPRHITGPAPTTHGECRYDRLLSDGYTEVARYDYVDATGAIRHFTVRLQHPEQPGKEFVQGHSNGDGRIHWTLKGVDTVLYRLPEITASTWAIVCEGEKSADRLASMGLPATTAPMGAGKWRDSYSDALKGKHVVIAPDNDSPGREHAQIVARSLYGKAESVRILAPDPHLPEKAGIDDWLAAGKTVDDLCDAVAALPKWTPPLSSITGPLFGASPTPADTMPAPDAPTRAMLDEAKQANSVPFRNYIPVERESEKRGKKIVETEKEPRTHQTMCDDLFRRFLGFPRKVGDDLLFDHDRDTGKIIYLRDSDSLMAWIARRSKHNPEWCRGDSMATQRQFRETVKISSRRYESISLIPSWPRRPDVYYAHGPIPQPCPNHSRFNALLDMFLPSSDEDRALLAAFICTPLWYIPGISRPSWIVDSRDGKGCGKTTLVELVAQLYGHPPISTTKGELTMHMETVKKRCVSQKGRDARIFLVDNVTGDFHCDELSGLITSKDITGMAPYGYGEETRPNDLVYAITANSATFSDSDIPDRSLYICVRRPPVTTNLESWRGTAQNYIEKHRLEIVADIIDMLESHVSYDVPCRTRFREFERAILQPCCGSEDRLAAVLEHVIGARKDSSTEEDAARYFIDVFQYELNLLGIDPGTPCFLLSEVANSWGRRAINESSSIEYKGRPVTLIRDLAKGGFIPQVDPHFKRLERNGKKERLSGLPWEAPDIHALQWIVAKEGNGQFSKRMA